MIAFVTYPEFYTNIFAFFGHNNETVFSHPSCVPFFCAEKALRREPEGQGIMGDYSA